MEVNLVESLSFMEKLQANGTAINGKLCWMSVTQKNECLVPTWLLQERSGWWNALGDIHTGLQSAAIWLPWMKKLLPFGQKITGMGNTEKNGIGRHRVCPLFMMHVMPKGFAKITHYSILNSQNMKKLLPPRRNLLYIFLYLFKSSIFCYNIIKNFKI